MWRPVAWNHVQLLCQSALVWRVANVNVPLDRCCGRPSCLWYATARLQQCIIGWSTRTLTVQATVLPGSMTMWCHFCTSCTGCGYHTGIQVQVCCTRLSLSARLSSEGLHWVADVDSQRRLQSASTTQLSAVSDCTCHVAAAVDLEQSTCWEHVVTVTV